MNQEKHVAWWTWGGAVAVATLAPFIMPMNIATEILIFGIFAVSANLLVGVSGLYSFGQAAFFGIGGYVAGYCFANSDWPLWAGLLMAVCSGALVAGLVGIISIRRTGIYFMMLTFAFNQMIYYIAYSWSSVTGGEDGLTGIERPGISLPGLGTLDIGNERNFYVLTAILFLVVMVFMYRLTKSPLGLVLEAAKHNPRRTASIGYSVYRAQVYAFVISGALAGVAGGMYSMLYRIMPIDAISWHTSATVLFMVVIGGMGNVLGPVFGAAIFIWLQGLLSLTWARWPLLFGLFIIVVVLFFRGGIVELISRLKLLLDSHKRRA